MSGKPLIIFDMDGVLVDVTGSYREVTRLTVIRYLTRVLGADIPERDFLSRSDVAAIKKSGGLNNDWDLTDAILDTYLFHALQASPELARRLEAVHRIGDDHGIIRKLRGVMERVDLSRLEALVHEKKVTRLFTSLPHHSPFLFNRGEVKTGNLSKRIFQEIYLGRALFLDIYEEEPVFYRDEGYIERELMIPSPDELSVLTASHVLSIATGRPGVEAGYALERFGIAHCFRAMVSEDDVVEAERSVAASLRKPNPFSLHLCAERSGWVGAGTMYYVGDMPDDMRAARRAGAVGLGFVNHKSDENMREREAHRDILLENGAEAVFGGFEELIDYLSAD
jgi:phosphoglycolate phosphatase-like HAD superfamily hydrolase